MNSISMVEASNSTSRDLSSPTEPVYQKIHLAPRFEGTKSPETSSPDQTPAEANEAMEIAMDRLKNHFRDILHLQVEGVANALTDPSSTTDSTRSFSLCLSALEESSYSGYHGPSQNKIGHLRSIARKMDAKGHLDKLIHVYVTERKSFMHAHFRKLWDEKSGICDVRRLEWGVLEAKIMRWIRAVHCCLRGILPVEKQLSNHVFRGIGDNAMGEFCFVAIVTDYVAELLDFADALSCCRQSPERLPKILVLYERFSCFRSDINSVFESEAAQTIRVRTDCTLSRLGEVVSVTLSDFEDTLLRELCNYPIPGGAIHTSTKYVMGYVTSLVSDCKETLMELITFKPSTNMGDLMISDLDVKDLERRTPLAAHFLWIIIVLHLNLERRSKCYKDSLLANLFMMNNVHYIVQQIRASAALTEMIGDKYINKLTENVQDSMTHYVSGTWDGLVYCLRHEGLNGSWVFTIGSGVSKKVLKERFKNFNTLFKEIHRMQMMWEVPDLELRMKLHRSILDKLIPPYRNFLGKFRSLIDRGRQPEKYIMYSAEQLEAKVLGLFSYCSYL